MNVIDLDHYNKVDSKKNIDGRDVLAKISKGAELTV